MTKQELFKKIDSLNKKIKELEAQTGVDQKPVSSKKTDNTDKLLKSFLDDSPDMFFSVNPAGIITSVNKTGAQVLGYTQSELVGSSVWNVIHKDDISEVKQKLKKIIASNRKTGALEFRKVTKDGKVIYVEEKTRLIKKNGTVTGININCRDVTPHRKVLEDLKEQEEKYRSLANNLKVGIYRSTADQKGKFLEVNPAFVSMFGYTSKDEMLDRSVSELYTNVNDRIRLLQDLEKEGFVKNREVELKKKNGETFIGSLTTVAIKNKSGVIHYYDGIVEDITVRKKFTGEIIRKEEQYRTLFDLSPNGILIEDKQGYIIDVNYAFSLMTGYKKEELLGKHVSKLSKNSKKSVKENIKRILQGEQLKHITQSCRKDGSIIYTELHERKFNLSGTEGILCIADDVTERINSQAELKQSEESYRGLFNSATDAIYIQDRDGKFLDVNEGACKMYGYPREYFIGKTPEFLSAPNMNDMGKVQKRTRDAFNGKPQIFEFWGIDVNKRVFPKEVRINKGTYFGKEVIVVFAQDITDRRAARKLLEEKEQKLRRIFDAFPVVYIKSNIKGVVKEITHSVKEITGFSPEEIIGKKAGKFCFAEKELIRAGQIINSEGEIKDFDIRIRCKNKSVINCSLTARRIDHNGQPVEIEGVLRDITDRKKAEVALQESNRRLTTLMDNLPGMVYRCRNDKNWSMEFVSNGCLEITGYKPAHIIDNKKIAYNDIIHDDDKKNIWENVQIAIKKKKSFRLVYKIITADGSVKWVWEQGSGIYDDSGDLLALEGFITDITEQRKAEEEVRKLSRSIEQSPNIVMIVNLNGDIEYVNPRFNKVTGYTLEESLGRNPRFLKSGKTPRETYTAMWNKLSSGLEWSGEFHNRTKNGEHYWESANIFPLKNDKGEVTHYIAMKEDITARKEMEKELIKAKEKAEESDRLKSAFLANMSHEIRTPMNAIIGFSQLLNDENISDKEKVHFIDLIQNSGNDLLRLIDDIIDISKIEAGQLKIFKSQYFLDNLLQELLISYREFLKTKPEKSEITLRYNNPKDDKTVIFTDIDRFKQIFRNLMNNAIKFTESGLIEFGFRLIKRSGKDVIEFYVRDTGIGIAEDKLEVIFHSFRQANDSDTKLYGGTGLGLAITRRMVEILGGKIWVKSVRGQGSTFYFTIPYKEFKLGYFSEQDKTTSHLENKISIDWNDKSILIVEDDDNSFLYFSNILNRTNIKIVRAVDGIEALEKVKAGNFNIVLMDINLPKLDGLEATIQLKLLKSDLPVVAQTAYAMQDEKEKCIKAGCDDYISKPVKISDFFKIINKHIV